MHRYVRRIQHEKKSACKHSQVTEEDFLRILLTFVRFFTQYLQLHCRSVATSQIEHDSLPSFLELGVINSDSRLESSSLTSQ